MFIQVQGIHSLTDFQRNAKLHIKRLKKSGQPEVLTVNGKAEVVVQDADAYQKLLEALERAEVIVAVQQSLKRFKEGQGIPLEVAMERLRKKHGLRRSA